MQSISESDRLKFCLLKNLEETSLPVPKDRKHFFKFVRKNFNSPLYTIPIIRSAWIKLISMDQRSRGIPEVISLASDDDDDDDEEEDNDMSGEVVIDSDAIEEVNANHCYDIVGKFFSSSKCNDKSAACPRRSSSRRKTFPLNNEKWNASLYNSFYDEPKAENSSKCANTSTTSSRRKGKKMSSVSPCKNVNKTTAAEKELLKKFQKNIIVKELLKRDKEMLSIQASADKSKKAVQIENECRSRLNKERVELLAKRKLYFYKRGIDFEETDYKSDILVSNNDMITNLVPCKNVIIERMPDIDLSSVNILQDTPNDFIDYDNIFPTSGLSISNSSVDIPVSRKSTNRRNSRSTPKKDNVDNLREQLFNDKIFELACHGLFDQSANDKNKNVKKNKKRKTC